MANQTFYILNRFQNEALDNVVMGGYAVSAYKHRFSVDDDLVVQASNLDEFTIVLDANGFEVIVARELDSSGGRYLDYGKNKELRPC